MANIGQKGGVFHVRFRLLGREYKKPLKTRDESAARAARHLIELTLHRVHTGQLQLPPDADPGDFVVGCGTVARPAGPRPPASRVPDPPSTRTLIDGYAAAHRPLLAPSYQASQCMHPRHLIRHLGDRADERCDRVPALTSFWAARAERTATPTPRRTASLIASLLPSSRATPRSFSDRPSPPRDISKQ